MRPRAFCAKLLCALLGFQLPALAQAPQENPPPQKLNLLIVEGEGAINNIKQRVAREPIVQVEDENHRPVAGASVVFLLPSNGASGTFANGSRLLTVLTDQNGRAVMQGFTRNNISGNLQIRVTASYRGQTASSTISQTNAASPPRALRGHGKLITVAVAAGGAAAAGIYFGTREATPKISSQGVSVTRP